MSAVGATSPVNRGAPSALGWARPIRYRAWQGLALLVAALVANSCGWRGISNVEIPGGPGSGAGSYTLYVQMPDTLAINGNSKVMVADVTVGSVRSIQLKNWIATLTLGVDKSVKLPKNTLAKIGQTSLLGSQHVELAAPPNPSPELLKDGDTIPLKNSSAFPTTEQTLASLSLILHGGGIPNEPTRSGPSSPSWTFSPTSSTSSAMTSPTRLTPPTGYWSTSVAAPTSWIACSPTSHR
jgi:phospholipid/cholesterol/gamma-HCH transport system substrate-binding protein